MKVRAVVFSFLFSSVAFAKGEIVVRAHSWIEHGSPVVLGDIVDMKGVDAKMKADLMNVPLAAAPAAGESLEFSTAAISGLLRNSLNFSDLPHVKIPHRVMIERSTHKWEPSVVAKELLQRWQPGCPDCKLEFDHLTLPAGQFVNWKLGAKSDLPRGNFSIPVEVEKEGQTATLWIQGQLVVRKLVPVAKRVLYFGERVQADDVEWNWRDVTLAQDGTPSNAEVIGRRVKTPLRADDIIFSGALEREKALRRGDVARVISGHGDWQVSVNAVAQQDAEIGDTVTLKNPRTNRDLTGVVVSKDEVEIR
jgi:flagella basal body P-ring formation protein FlgA